MAKNLEQREYGRPRVVYLALGSSLLQCLHQLLAFVLWASDSLRRELKSVRRAQTTGSFNSRLEANGRYSVGRRYSQMWLRRRSRPERRELNQKSLQGGAAQDTRQSSMIRAVLYLMHVFHSLCCSDVSVLPTIRKSKSKLTPSRLLLLLALSLFDLSFSISQLFSLLSLQFLFTSAKFSLPSRQNHAGQQTLSFFNWACSCS